MKKRIRVKRPKQEDDSLVSPLMESYVKAVVQSAIKEVNPQNIRAQLAALHIEMRVCFLIFTDLQASANLAAASLGSSKATLEELVNHLQMALGINLSVLESIQAEGKTEISTRDLTTWVNTDRDPASEGRAIDLVMEELRAQAAHERGPDGEEFEDMIENAMGSVDDDVDVGESIRQRLEEHDVRGSGGTRQAQRRRRPVT